MNKLFKKTVALVASMGVLASTVNVTALGASVVNAEFTTAFNWAKKIGVTTMTNEESFGAYNSLTREQAPKMIVNGLMAASCVKDKLKKTKTYNNEFSDLSTADASLQSWIKTAYEHGLVNGWDGKYHPVATVSRGQVMTILGRALYGKLPESGEYWKNYYKLLKAEGIFTVENASAPIKRYELVLVLYRIANNCGKTSTVDVDKLVCQLVGTCDKPTTTTPTTPTTPTVVRGDVTVALSSKTAPQQFVAANQAGVNVMALDVTAGSEDARFQSLTVNLEGVIKDDQIKKLYLYDANGKELDDAFVSRGDAKFRLPTTFKVAAKKTETIYVVADMKPVRASAATGSNYLDGKFQLSVAKTDIEGAKSVGGVFPIISNQIVVLANTSSTTLVVDGGKTSAVTVKADDKAIELADFVLKNEAKKKITFRGITLQSLAPGGYNDYLEGVIDNVKIFIDNKDVTKAVVINKDEVMITTNDYTFDSRTANVRIEGKVIGGRVGDKFSLVIEKTSDIKAVETNTNGVITVHFEDGEVINTDMYLVAKHEIGQVDNRIQLASDSPKNQYIAKGAENVTILKANLNLKKDADVQRVTVVFNPADFAGFDGASLVIDGYEVDYKSRTSLTGSTVFKVDGKYTAGSHKVEVRVNVKDDVAANGKKIAAKIDGATITGRYTNTRDNLNVTGVAQGGTMEVRAAGAVITPKATSTKDSIVAGTNSTDVLSFNVQAYTVEDVTIDSFDIMITGSALSGTSHSFDVVAKAGTQSDSSSLYSNNTKASFTNLGWKVKAGQTLNVVIKNNFPSTLRTVAGNNAIKYTLANVKLKDSSNDIVTPSASSVTKTYAVVGNATLVASKNASEKTDAIIVADEKNQEVAKMNLKIENDDVLIKRLAFKLTGNIANVNTYVDSFDLYNGSTKLASAGIQAHSGNQYVEFVFANDHKLAKDATATMTVKANATNFTSANAQAAANSGVALELLAGAVPSTTIETKIVAANAVTTSNVTIGGSYTSNARGVRAASLFANATAKTSSTLVSNGLAYEFTLTAQGDDVKLTGGKFSLTPQNVTLGALELYMGETKVGTVSTGGVITINTGANVTINKGSTQNFKLRFGTVTLGTNASTTQVKIYLSDVDDTLKWQAGGAATVYNKKNDVTGLPTGIWTIK